MDSISPKNQFQQISTQWGLMEQILLCEGVKSLADYLASRYYHPLAEWARKIQPEIDEFSSYEIVSDVFLELIKNDYQKLQTLDKNRDHLRALLTTILKRKLFKRYSLSQKITYTDEFSEKILPQYLDFVIDFNQCLEQLQKERPLIYKAFRCFHLEEKNLKETAQELQINENAVSQRLFHARKWLQERLEN